MKSGHWKGIDHFLVADISHNYQRETFNALGIADKVITSKMLKGAQAINAQRIMVIPTNKILPKWGCSALQKFFPLFKLSPDKQGAWRNYQRIYLSREDAKFRQVINEDEVVSFLEKYGFKKVVPAKMAVATQAHLFRNADVIAGPHGSSFTNIASCRKGTKIIEFFSTEYAHSTYWEMSNYLGLSYGYISDDGSSPISSHEKWYGEKDMMVNLSRLEKALDMMQVERKSS
jgi:capsular polysaccharide biosynthesis protein